MTDWTTCPAVERNPRKIGGAWAFAGTRVPLHALFENLASGATIDEFVEGSRASRSNRFGRCWSTKQRR